MISTTTTDHLIQLSESPRSGFGQVDFAEQNLEQKVFSAVFGSSGSIFMDGLALYLENTDLPSILFSPQAYKSIQAPLSAEIIELSFRVCGLPASGTSEENKSSLMARLNADQTATLAQLDEAFYSTGEIIDDLLFDYVASHPLVFGATPIKITRRA